MRTTILLVICLLSGVSSRADELFFAEAEVQAGPEVSRITVTIVNNADQPLELQTGSRGGPGQHDDRVPKRILGTPVARGASRTHFSDQQSLDHCACAFIRRWDDSPFNATARICCPTQFPTGLLLVSGSVFAYPGQVLTRTNRLP